MAISLLNLLDLWPNSCAVLMPTPLIAPTVSVRPILSSMGVFLRLARQARITVIAYWVGRNALIIWLKYLSCAGELTSDSGGLLWPSPLARARARVTPCT